MSRPLEVRTAKGVLSFPNPQTDGSMCALASLGVERVSGLFEVLAAGVITSHKAFLHKSLRSGIS